MAGLIRLLNGGRLRIGGREYSDAAKRNLKSTINRLCQGSSVVFLAFEDRSGGFEQKCLVFLFSRIFFKDYEFLKTFITLG